MNADLVAEVFRFPGRSTRAIVDLDAISGNVKAIRDAIGPTTGLMAVVKANAYGHGAIPVAATALEAGADHLAVATLDEGIQLRGASVHAPVLVMGPIDFSEIDLAIGHSIDLSVGSLQFAHAVGMAAEQLEVTGPVKLHLKVDTGMHRYGTDPGDAVEIARYVHDHPLLRLRGVFTHFARSDEDDIQPTELQAGLLDHVIDSLGEIGVRPELVHQSNSAATIRSRNFDKGLVRTGIAVYGLRPSAEVDLLPGMRPAMTIVSRVARVFSLEPGESVSYGATFRANGRMRAALVPVGYADGYPRLMSNASDMYVRGSCCPVIGRVCMDQTVIALPDTLEVSIGDPVVVYGGWENDSVRSFDDIAKMASTINYEIATRVAFRVPRFYLRSGRVSGMSDLSGYRPVSDGLKNNE